MEFKDYYATLGVERTASQDDIKRAYRKLARKYHPDVSKLPDAEMRFKEVAEAHEALIDPERRAAYDELGRRHAQGQDFDPAAAGGGGFEFSGRGFDGTAGGGADFSDFFESIFGRGGGERERRGGAARGPGADHHARVVIELVDAYRGARRTVSLRAPVIGADGHSELQERQLEVNIPAGVRNGQHLRLAGQGSPGPGGGPPGDLYLEIALRPHPRFRVDGGDVYVDLPLAPWEAALGASVALPLPDGEVSLTVPAGSLPGRKMRLKGKGLPGKTAGDLYAVLVVELPPSDSAAAQAAWAALAAAFPNFDARMAAQARAS